VNVSPNSHVVHQTPKSKLNESRVHFAYTDIGRWRPTKDHHALYGLARARLPISTNAENSPLESIRRPEPDRRVEVNVIDPARVQFPRSRKAISAAPNTRSHPGHAIMQQGS